MGGDQYALFLDQINRNKLNRLCMRHFDENDETSALRMRLGVLNTLDRLQACASLDNRRGDREWRDLLELSKPELEAIRALERSVPDRALEHVAKRFHVNTQDLMAGNLDFRDIAIRESQPLGTSMPELYMVAAFGRRRGTITALDFLEWQSGWRMRRQLLKQFEVTEAMLSNPMDPISMRFMTDVCHTLRRKHDYTAFDFFNMGMNSYAGNQGTLIAQVFENCDSPAEVYERFLGDMMKFFELNCQYTIVQLTPDRCIVDVHSRRDVAEALRVKHLGNRELCVLKAGMLACMTGFIGRDFARVLEPLCAHRGDPCCRYEVEYKHCHQRNIA